MKLLAVERFAGKWPAEAATALTSAEVASPIRSGVSASNAYDRFCNGQEGNADVRS